MSALEQSTVEQVSEQRDALAGRLFQSGFEAMEALTVYLGDRLGLYQALADGGPATTAELAARTGTAERPLREWLEQQAAAGILVIDDVSAEEGARRYHLPAGHAEVLVDSESLSYMTPFLRFLPALPMPAIVEAFRSGKGLPWNAYGADAREGQASMNRPHYMQFMGTEWLPKIPDVHGRLMADPPARVADIGCGAGWSSIAIAKAYPKVRVDGFDLDETAIEMARRHASENGVADRVQFHVQDAADAALSGRYDLVTAFECVHDLGRPVEALKTMRRLVADGGAVIVMDERVGESFAAPADELERFFYAASVLLCLHNGLADGPAGTGTVMRPATLSRYAREAGFRDVEVLPIEHDFWRFYRLVI